MRPLISVVVPTKNVAETFDTCLDSLRQQTFQNYEVLVLDACSKDGTLELVRDFKKKLGTDLKCVSSPDNGVYDAMNRGITLASGQWLYFLGADDRVADCNVFNDVARTLEKENADLVYGDVVLKSDGSRYCGKSSRTRLMFDRNISHQAIFYHHSLFEKVGSFNLSYPIWADWDLNIRCFKLPGVRCVWLNRVIALYNDLSGISHQLDEEFRKQLPAAPLRWIGRAFYSMYLQGKLVGD